MAPKNAQLAKISRFFVPPAKIFMLEVYTAVYSFTAAAFHTDKPVIAEDPLALVKLALPVFTVVRYCYFATHRPGMKKDLSLHLSLMSSWVLDS